MCNQSSGLPALSLKRQVSDIILGLANYSKDTYSLFPPAFLAEVSGVVVRIPCASAGFFSEGLSFTQELISN